MSVWPWTQLDRIQAQIVQVQATLKVVLAKEDKIMSNQAALDAALGTLTADVATLKTAVDALVAAIPPGVDLSAEVQQVQDAFASIESTTGEVTAATPPPAEAA